MTETPPDSSLRRPTLRHYLLLCAIVALWIDFSHVHSTLNSDTLLFTIIARYEWTPFFWEQDRIGMFVPLLTTWCPNPLATLLIQTAISTFMGLALPLLLVEIVYPRPASRLGVVLANALMLALAPVRVRNNLLFECCYPQAMFLGCAGLLILGNRDRPSWWRYPMGFGLFVLAHWVYLGVSVWLMPLAFWNAVIRPGVGVSGLRDLVAQRIRFFSGWASMLLLGGAFGLGMWFMTLANEAAGGRIEPTPSGGLPASEWRYSWINFSNRLDAWPGMMAWKSTVVGLSLIGLFGMISQRCRPGYSLLASCFVLSIAGGTEFLFMGTREWPVKNEYHFRYILGSIVCVQVILGLLATAPLCRWAVGSGRWFAFLAAGLILIAAATVQYGFPSPGTPRADLDEQHGAAADEVRAAKVDAIGGDYWTVWPLYLYAGVASSTGNDPPYPIAFRSGIFRPRWEATHPNGLRVAVPSNSAQERQEFFRAALEQGLSEPIKIATHGRFDIYSTRPLAIASATPSR